MLTSRTKQHSCWLLGIALEKDDRSTLADLKLEESPDKPLLVSKRVLEKGPFQPSPHNPNLSYRQERVRGKRRSQVVFTNPRESFTLRGCLVVEDHPDYGMGMSLVMDSSKVGRLIAKEKEFCEEVKRYISFPTDLRSSLYYFSPDSYEGKKVPRDFFDSEDPPPSHSHEGPVSLRIFARWLSGELKAKALALKNKRVSATVHPGMSYNVGSTAGTNWILTNLIE